VTFAPLRGRRPKRRGKPDKQCMAGCGTMIPGWQWLCDACFGALPYLRKKEICDARAAHETQRIFGLSRDAAQWLAAQRAEAAER
jgi:hypothetical protein